jgi:hypothetical protein
MATESFQTYLSLSREDVFNTGLLDEAQVEALSDAQMQWLADHIATECVMDAWWEALRYLVTQIPMQTCAFCEQVATIEANEFHVCAKHWPVVMGVDIEDCDQVESITLA